MVDNEAGKKGKKGKKKKTSPVALSNEACEWLEVVFCDKTLRPDIVWQELYFSPQRNPAHSPPINWQQMKKNKSQNKNQTKASSLNMSVSEREKPFQLLDVQENMNPR